MVSIRVSHEGWKFLAITLSTAGICSIEYYLFYHQLPQFTRQKFLSTKLPDKSEYAQEVLIDTGSSKFIFKHKGGSQAVESLLKDTYGNREFRKVLGVQFGSTFAIALAVLKKRALIPIAGLSLLFSNLAYAYPTIESSVNLLRLSELVAENNLEVWENLNEMRFIQRVDETNSLMFRRCREWGLDATIGGAFYCAPLFTGFTSAVIWIYLRNRK